MNDHIRTSQGKKKFFFSVVNATLHLRKHKRHQLTRLSLMEPVTLAMGNQRVEIPQSKDSVFKLWKVLKRKIVGSLVSEHTNLREQMEN